VNTDVNQLHSFKLSFPLFNSYQICNSLARMIFFIAAVNHWNARSFSHSLQIRILKHTHHNTVNVSRQILRLIVNIGQSKIRCSPVNIQGVTAKLRHRHFKSNSGSRAGLLEN